MSEPESDRPTAGHVDVSETSPAEVAQNTPTGAARPDGPDPLTNGAGRHGAAAPPAARPRIGDTRPAPPPVRPVPAEVVRSGGAARDTAEPTRAPAHAAPGDLISDPELTSTSTARHAAPPVPGASLPGAALGTTVGGGSGALRNGVVRPPAHLAADADDDLLSGDATGKRSGRARRRGGRDRKGKNVGRYLVCVHVQPHLTQIAVLEGRSLVEHYVSRAADETTQIDGNIYRGRVQNVLPGMEAAFVDIGIPKNAVLYRGDVRYDVDDVEGASRGNQPRIEEVLRTGQVILCQVTKNPIGAKGARLTQEVSLPGRFAVLVPNSSAFGISKRLGDNERRRLRKIVDEVRPEGHGLIVRTAAENATTEELRRDVASLLARWKTIEEEAGRGSAPGLLYREPDLAVRILREELNSDYRGVVIDDLALFEQVREYVADVSPELAERVEYFDTSLEPLPIFERYHVHEQLHKALDRKVWLPSGGSLIIERTEALTVIDVNTGKNVGKSNLEETVFRNNLEAAEEVARQLRLRDIGGIIVIDFIDMEIRENRDKVAAALRNALARDKTRTQVFDISELGLVEMTRKRISEGLIESLSTVCEVCNGRGIVLDRSAF
jgi:ribonuclease E